MPQIFYTEQEYCDGKNNITKNYEKEIEFLRFESDIVKNIIYSSKQEQNKKDKESQDKGYWHYIPNNNEYSIFFTFKKLKERLRQKRKIKFIELGSGIGYYTRMATHFGFKSVGIEFDETLIEKAKQSLFPLYNEKDKYQTYKLIHGDIMNYGKEIKKADIIYFYSPFRHEKAGKFIEFVVKNAKVGAYILAGTHCNSEYKTLNDLTNAKKIEKIEEEGHVYKVLKK